MTEIIHVCEWPDLTICCQWQTTSVTFHSVAACHAAKLSCMAAWSHMTTNEEAWKLGHWLNDAVVHICFAVAVKAAVIRRELWHTSPKTWLVSPYILFNHFYDHFIRSLPPSQARGRCAMLQYPWLIVSAKCRSERYQSRKSLQSTSPVAIASTMGTAQISGSILRRIHDWWESQIPI